MRLFRKDSTNLQISVPNNQSQAAGDYNRIPSLQRNGVSPVASTGYVEQLLGTLINVLSSISAQIVLLVAVVAPVTVVVDSGA